MAFQLICRPVATTRDSYPILRPEVVVTELVLGSNVLTFSEMCARWEGMREARGRRVSSFCFRPAPTSVLCDNYENRVHASGRTSMRLPSGLYISFRVEAGSVIQSGSARTATTSSRTW